jgi:hypothetical protein
MSLNRLGLRAIVLGGLAALMLAAFSASSASAEPSTFCVKATKTTTKPKHYTGGWNDKNCAAVNATHQGKYEKLASFSESEEQQLKALLKYVKVQASGVAGKPTVQFSGANVQIVSGAGKTNAAVNGEGNLVIGYDENAEKHEQTGSHDLILGEEQNFTSYGGLLAGNKNAALGPFGSVAGGEANTAASEHATVSGGYENTASGAYASASGGALNTANGKYASVSGGKANLASGEATSVSGGESNTASAFEASVSGGGGNKATFKEASVSGGVKNEASGEIASVSGGESNHASGRLASVSGGLENTASSLRASVSGGVLNTASGAEAWVGGGEGNTASFSVSSIFGGKALATKAEFGALPACVAPGTAGELC